MSTLSAGTKQRIDADGFAVIAGVLGYREIDTLKADMHKMPLHRSRAGVHSIAGRIIAERENLGEEDAAKISASLVQFGEALDRGD